MFCRYALVDSPDADVFGITNAKKAVDCNCPNCGRPVASSRFAPHLEKCMGTLFTSAILIMHMHCHGT